jgi:ribonuclease P protein component
MTQPDLPRHARPAAPRPTLRRKQRLRKTGQFKAAYAGRARVGDGSLVAYALANGLAVTRLGVSVGKRCGGSVRRNRIKRRLREAFRLARAEFPPGYDIVLVPLDSGRTFAEYEQSIRLLVPEAIRRARVAAARKGSAEGPQVQG